MKILVVTQYYWPESFLINELCEELVSRGHEVSVLTGKPNYPKGDFYEGYSFFGSSYEEKEGVKVYRVPLVPRGNGSSLRLALNYVSFVFFGLILAPFRFKNVGIDRIFIFQMSPVTQALPAIVIKFLRKIPMTMWVQDIWPDSLEATGAIRSKKVLSLVEKLVAFIYSQCDLILVQSNSFKSKVEGLLKVPKEIRYVPNWAPAFFKPVQKKSNNLLPDGFNILFAGNLGEAQDFPAILDAAEMCIARGGAEKINWIILGDGSRKKWIESEVQKRSISNIHLLGRHPMSEMPKYFSEADVLLVSLKKDPVFEMTIPSKIQAYLASGRPILTALDGEGSRVVMEAQAGVIGASGSAEILYENVLKLSKSSKGSLEAMGSNGRKYFQENFEKNIVIDQIEEAICHS